MATVSFDRTSQTEIYCSISGAYTATNYSYALQVQSNSSGNWNTNPGGEFSINSSGRGSVTISVNDNSTYNCRVVAYYRGSAIGYYPDSDGEPVYPYSPPTIDYNGSISLSSSGDYKYNTSVIYQGYVTVKVTISSGAGSGWYIRVNSSAKNTKKISSSGTYDVTLDYLYDGVTSSKYTINLYDPDDVRQDYINVYHRATPTYTRTLKYNANGGSGAPSTQTVEIVACYTKATMTISSKTPTRSGYAFLGWSTSSTATSATYDPGDSISVSGTTTLYAVWKQTWQALVPNITSLTVTNKSASGFTVTAKQSNLEAGSWYIQISTSSSFSSVTATSTGALSSTATLSHTFTGLSANTLYYIRVYNVYSGTYKYTSASWSARTGITAFSWTSNDAANIVAGEDPSAYITASKWNELQDKINAVRVRNGYSSLSFSRVYRGDRITAAAFEAVRTGISSLSGFGSVPTIKEPGDPILASDFANGTSSLKSAINRAISNLNS